jgi:uncharacterized membrane protein
MMKLKAQTARRVAYPSPVTRSAARDESSPREAAPALMEEGLSLAQAARVLTGVLWLAWGTWLTLGSSAPSAALLGSITAMAGFVALAAAVLTRSQERQRVLDGVLFMGTIALVVILPVVSALAGGYATDELAYDQAAAAGLLHGVNPYTMDFTHALQTFGVGTGATMTLDGTVVPFIAYPSLSFLVYVPAVFAFGEHSYAGLLVDVAAWACAGWVLWRLLDDRMKAWVPVLVAFPAFLGAVIMGATDSLFVPLELIAVCGWDRFGKPGQRGVWRWAGPVALGLACCMKQQPWLLAPFLVAGISIEAHRRKLDWRRIAARYVGLAFAAFIIPNIPFMVWNPAAWISRLAMPVTGALVPMGFGPAGLMRPYSIGGGNLTVFGLAAGCALLAAFALFFVRYERLRRVLPLLPLGALLLSTRSFSSYFTFCVPALVMNAASLSPSWSPRIGMRMRAALTGVAVTGAAAALLFTGVGLLAPAPLRIAVTSSNVRMNQLFVVAEVTNVSGRKLDPRFFLAKGMYFNQEVTVRSGPAELGAGDRATYVFEAEETAVTPHPGDVFQMQAGTRAPESISTSATATVGAGP